MIEIKKGYKIINTNKKKVCKKINNSNRNKKELKEKNIFRVKWREPASTILSNGIKVYSSGVPGGGDILIFLLNIFDNFRFTKESIADINSSIVTFQNMIEAFKYAYAFRTKLGDSDFVDLTQVIIFSFHISYI